MNSLYYSGLFSLIFEMILEALKKNHILLIYFDFVYLFQKIFIHHFLIGKCQRNHNCDQSEYLLCGSPCLCDWINHQEYLQTLLSLLRSRFRHSLSTTYRIGVRSLGEHLWFCGWLRSRVVLQNRIRGTVYRITCAHPVP